MERGSIQHTPRSLLLEENCFDVLGLRNAGAEGIANEAQNRINRGTSGHGCKVVRHVCLQIVRIGHAGVAVLEPIISMITHDIKKLG